jgi:hypothetical protein
MKGEWMWRGELFHAAVLLGLYEYRSRDYLRFNRHMDERIARRKVERHKFSRAQSSPVYFRLRKRIGRR